MLTLYTDIDQVQAAALAEFDAWLDEFEAELELQQDISEFEAQMFAVLEDNQQP